jgi:hypothetical protein
MAIYMIPDGVIRYSTTLRLAPVGLAGLAVRKFNATLSYCASKEIEHRRAGFGARQRPPCVPPGTSIIGVRRLSACASATIVRDVQRKTVASASPWTIN